MDSSNHLTAFFRSIREDGRISITHIGIYSALLQYHIENGASNPIQVFSHQIMDLAKLSSAITYYRCVKDLSNYGYIRYEPSFNRKKGSKIYFIEKTRQ